ncbi:hypothetical protein H4582DRAFT_619850 [Lactarius indigo]|nr:hypothetical protein H4582DRAFT_619850 [Lactarius indigo]
MAPSLPPGEARPAPKPQPIGSFPFLFLCTTATVCLLFVIWRRSETLRTVVAHQLKTWTRQEALSASQKMTARQHTRSWKRMTMTNKDMRTVKVAVMVLVGRMPRACRPWNCRGLVLRGQRRRAYR